jgi:hypothetical protein
MPSWEYFPKISELNFEKAVSKVVIANKVKQSARIHQ